jgi:alanine racemase
MFSFLKNLFKPKVEPMNIIHIDKKALLDNFVYLKTLKPQVRLFPVVKSNAYGHGLDQFLQVYKKVDVPYLVVDSFPEYSIIARHSNHNVLLLGETLSKNYKEFDLKRTAFAVYNVETLHGLAKLKKKLNIHLFLNTGMNREGIQPSLLINFLETLKKYPQIKVEGVMSHFHSADTPSGASMQTQIDLFKQMYYTILEYGHAPKWRHIGASAGLLKMEDDFFNAYRPGLALYGYNPLSPEDPFYDRGEKLKPALSLSSVIVALNEISEGEGVSYGEKWIAPEDATVATVPVGYFEGLPRSLAGKLFFRRNKELLAQIGTICMNLCSCLGKPKMQIGDQVRIIEKEKDSHLGIDHIAREAETISYEILVKLDRGIRRVVE